MKWQTIDTAPKDGTPILVFEPQATNDETGAVEPQIMLVEWREYELWPHSTLWVGWCVPGSWQDEEGSYAEADHPTHWMPLPTPPQEPPQ